MAGKKFTTKRFRVRSKADVRAHNLKVNPKTFNVVESVEQSNHALIKKLEAKIQEIESK
jgi:hypothetical protein